MRSYRVERKAEQLESKELERGTRKAEEESSLERGELWKGIKKAREVELPEESGEL